MRLRGALWPIVAIDARRNALMIKPRRNTRQDERERNKIGTE